MDISAQIESEEVLTRTAVVQRCEVLGSKVPSLMLCYVSVSDDLSSLIFELDEQEKPDEERDSQYISELSLGEVSEVLLSEIDKFAVALIIPSRKCLMELLFASEGDFETWYKTLTSICGSDAERNAPSSPKPVLSDNGAYSATASAVGVLSSNDAVDGSNQDDRGSNLLSPTHEEAGSDARGLYAADQGVEELADDEGVDISELQLQNSEMRSLLLKYEDVVRQLQGHVVKESERANEAIQSVSYLSKLLKLRDDTVKDLMGMVQSLLSREEELLNLGSLCSVNQCSGFEQGESLVPGQ